ncbi:putative transcription factor [Iris pallida]|uniref:Transcription factor n=1 Tax=Iris pallida TaxID=29817 RepID=A0AAX6EUS4_IRIPA|nr:putative transcription factor [Iris pallida]
MASTDEQQNNLPILPADEDDSSSVSDSDEEEREHFGFTDDFSIPTPNPDTKSNPNYDPTPPPLRRTPGGLFQRLWTDDDEIVILEGFLDFVTERGTTHANYQHDTGPFYDRIRGRIPLDFNKSQLVEKLRRLKKKYRTVAARIGPSCAAAGDSFAFRTPHERRVYDIARNIWSPSLKRPRGRRSNGGGAAAADEERRVRRRDRRVDVPVVLEEESRSAMPPVAPSVSSVVEATVRCCLSPLFKELVEYGADGASGGVCLDSWKVFSGGREVEGAADSGA